MQKRLTTEEYIQKAKMIHGDRFNYSLVDYKHSLTKIKIICPIHGEFEQIPSSHLRNKGCPSCSLNSRAKQLTLTTEEYIQRAKKIHGDKYDYSLTDYKTSLSKIKVICKIHSEFEILANLHISGSGCQKCSYEQQGKNQTITPQEFVRRANEIHNNKYDYSLLEYKTTKDKINIICPIHGIFNQCANSHMNGRGCRKCYFEKLKLSLIKTTDDFIIQSSKIHNNKYDYSKSIYTACKNKLIIICPKHGEFLQEATKHMHGHGCRKCQYDTIPATQPISFQDFVYRSKIKHNDRYSYNVDYYTNGSTKTKINCKIHGDFWQIPQQHMSGQGCPLCAHITQHDHQKVTFDEFVTKANKKHNTRYKYIDLGGIGLDSTIGMICKKHGTILQKMRNHLNTTGCPKCKMSRGELLVEYILTKHNIMFKFQKRFNDCKNKRELPFDFYLPEHNICIEYDGELHYETYRGQEKEKYINKLKQTKLHDSIKNLYCETNNIRLLRIPYWITDIEEMIESFIN